MQTFDGNGTLRWFHLLGQVGGELVRTKEMQKLRARIDYKNMACGSYRFRAPTEIITVKRQLSSTQDLEPIMHFYRLRRELPCPARSFLNTVEVVLDLALPICFYV